MRQTIVKLISSCACNGPGESLGSCTDRKYGQCGEVANLSYCVIQNLANHLIANGVTVQRWIPVTEGMPEERQSVVPGLGTVSKPVLVTWMDPTSDKPYPDNCFVREGITRNGEFTLNHINGDLVAVAWMPQPRPYELKENEG